jgi:hypothetical protein
VFGFHAALTDGSKQLNQDKKGTYFMTTEEN